MFINNIKFYSSSFLVEEEAVESGLFSYQSLAIKSQAQRKKNFHNVVGWKLSS
jgi:hypothetical protein